MDCYIVRVYRHITGDDGESDEIAGLVERVGQRDNSRPFSSYQSLVSALRDDHSSHDACPPDTEKRGRPTTARMRVVDAVKGS